MEDKIRQIKNRQLSDVFTIIYIFRNEIKYNGDRLVSKRMYSFVGIDDLGNRTVADIVIEREDDVEYKLVAMPEDNCKNVTKEEIINATYFLEKYFKSKVLLQ